MTELVFILDRSGSMSGLEADTIGGFNSMLAQQKREAGEALVSTVLFANDSTVIHDRLPLCEVPPLTEKEYFTRGCTALLDAIGLKENDRVELIQSADAITIKKASPTQHKALEERLTAFYGKPIEQIGRIPSEEMEWGKAEGSEAW